MSTPNRNLVKEFLNTGERKFVNCVGWIDGEEDVI